MKTILVFLFFISTGTALLGREYHVSVAGSDLNAGSEELPFKTIQQAAKAAYPGDVITVHAGTYREWVNPPRGGSCESGRIIYRAAPGEHVEIKGFERISNWKKEKSGAWKIILPNSFFGEYNPYRDFIFGDWFSDRGRKHHTGEVFLNNKSLYEAMSPEEVLNPAPAPGSKDPEGSKYKWYCESDGENTTILANFHDYDPNEELVELSVRKTCFYPDKPGINYLTIRGFHISQAATQWAPPTAEQVGMVATHWNKGWVIEDNVISNSKCSGITLGKERSTGQNAMSLTGADGTLDYIKVIFRTLRHGWNRENIGAHVVRNNVIFACEQTGICGSMGAAFSIIENNHIHDIWTKRQFTGAEIGGIKFHAAIDTQIRNNRIHNAGRALWLDWMTQGTWISGNLFYDNDIEDLLIEVSHGPFLADNNIFASKTSLYDVSQGGAYVHNLFGGTIHNIPDRSRYTPFHVPHSTEVAGFSIIPGGDNRFLNNLFVPAISTNAAGIRGRYGLSGYDKTAYPSFAEGNAYYNTATPFAKEDNRTIVADFNPGLMVKDKGDEVFLSFSIQGLSGLKTELVTTDRMGKAKFAQQSYEAPDGNPIIVDYDYFRTTRPGNPAPGPFENIRENRIRLKVWPKN